MLLFELEQKVVYCTIERIVQVLMIRVSTTAIMKLLPSYSFHRNLENNLAQGIFENYLR